MSKPNVEIAAFVGLDWAAQKHVVTLQEANSDQRQCFTLDQAPEALQNWIQLLRDRFAGRRKKGLDYGPRAFRAVPDHVDQKKPGSSPRIRAFNDERAELLSSVRS